MKSGVTLVTRAVRPLRFAIRTARHNQHRGTLMRKSMLRLYAPFIGLAVVQALFIAMAPSEPAGREELTAGDFGGSGEFNGDLDGEVFVDPETGEVIQLDPDTGRPVGGASGSGGAARRSTGGSTATSGGTGGGAAAAGDTSHCKGNLQFNLLHNGNPACKPKWPEGADNGGATYAGVTAETIKVVWFIEQANPAVNAILARQKLARTPEDEEAVRAVGEAFINRFYETYGRKVEIVIRRGDCPQTPPNVDACLAAARKVIKEDAPFIVFWTTPLYPVVFDEFARSGTISIGGWHFHEDYFTKRRPFRYDVFMDGTRGAELFADYYCKKLAGQNATHSGQVIHREIGLRGQVRRRLGISTPEAEANVRTAQHAAELVRQCDPGAKPPVITTYASNIETASRQADETAASYIAADVTTVTCFCDPIAPVFGSRSFTKNEYFPETLLSGMGLIDYDLLGRLYEPSQYAHAFGPSHLQVWPRFEDTDVYRGFRAVGSEQRPCDACNLPWGYVSMAGSMIHYAGPDLNPLTVERGMLTAPPAGGWERTGGNPIAYLVKFGPGDYTSISDAKEVYWKEDQPSGVDGQPPSYFPVNGGRRYQHGEWQPGMDQIPVKPQ